jgi:hypothetical protein
MMGYKGPSPTKEIGAALTISLESGGESMAEWMFDRNGQACLILDGDRVRNASGVVVGWISRSNRVCRLTPMCGETAGAADKLSRLEVGTIGSFLRGVGPAQTVATHEPDSVLRYPDPAC